MHWQNAWWMLAQVFFHGIALIINARETKMGIFLVFSLVSIIVLTLRVNKRGQYHFGILPRPASGNLWPQTKTKNMKITGTAQTSRRAMKNPIGLHVKRADA